MTRILIADDHRHLLEVSCNSLKSAFPSASITSLCDTTSVCDEIEKRNCDLYILDLEFKHRRGYELIMRIKKTTPSAKIIVHTMQEEIEVTKQLMALKVDGIVLKEPTSEHLVNAVKAVLANDNYLCPRFNYLECKKVNGYKDDRPSRRELEVLKYVAEGKTTEDIASKLGISAHTVETHRRKLKDKLRAETPSHMISIALKDGLISLNELHIDAV